MRSSYPGTAGPTGAPGYLLRTRRTDRSDPGDRRDGVAPARGSGGRRDGGQRRTRGLRPAAADRRGRSTVPRPSGRARTRRRGVPITGRTAVLGLVVCVLAVTLAYPTRSFLTQRGEISSLRTALHAQQDRVDGLQQAIRNYADPAFVESEARRRLQYQYPGDVVYRLPAPPDQPAQRRQGRALLSTIGDSSWYVKLWDSNIRAGRKGAGGVLPSQPPEPGTGGTAPDGPTQPGRDPELPGGTG